MKKITLLIPVLMMISMANSYAWNGHSILTLAALRNISALTTKSVKPETLEDFLNKEEKALEKVLADNERWAEQHVHHYPPLPKNLTFMAGATTPIKQRFINALRINPELAYPLFIESADKGESLANKIVPRSAAMLSMLVNAAWIYIQGGVLQQIDATLLVSPLTILATASDEPDYGMDINLWEDNGTPYGKLYQWGKEPFGNKDVSFATQAPFHMGFYYESAIINLVTPDFQRSYLAYRVHTYITLAKYAFSTHHDYWGYRFLGWALHYVQDLGQPYHSTLAPNVSTPKIFWAQGLAALGFPDYKMQTVILVTNRHYAFEDYVYFMLRDLLDQKNNNEAILQAMADTTQDNHYPAYNDNYPHDVVAKESNQLANELDALVEKAFPPLYVENPYYIFYMTDPYINLTKVIGNERSPDLDNLHAIMQTLLSHLAAHTRNLVKFAAGV